MLNISDLHFSYSKRSPEILKGIDLSLEKGEIGILLGKNGAGKTTLFSTVLGIHKPYRGEILLENENVLKMTAKKRAEKIAYVPQTPVFGSLSVYDTVLMGRVSRFGIRAGENDHRIVKRVLEETGLYELSDRPADRLSGGEKQKTAIARALAQEPLLMIFDEPTGNLDIANESLLIGEAKRLAKEKSVTVLMALHDLNTAFYVGDKFFFLKDGVIHTYCGKDGITEDIVNEVFDVKIRIAEFENRKIILGG